MKPTRPSTLATVAVVFALAAWLLLHLIYQRLPPLPWTGAPALLLAAALETWTGRDLRARITGRRGVNGTKPPDPLFVSRMVALAKASSLVAAAVGGLAAGVLLACAALYLEFCCRVPDPPGRDQDAETPPLR